MLDILGDGREFDIPPDGFAIQDDPNQGKADQHGGESEEDGEGIFHDDMRYSNFFNNWFAAVSRGSQVGPKGGA